MRATAGYSGGLVTRRPGSVALGVWLAACVLTTSAFAQVVGINQQYNNQYGLALIGAGAAYTAGYTGAGVIVGVGDSGFAITQPPFLGKVDPRSTNYLITSPGAAYDPNQLTPLSATDTHGSHVAGIIGAANDDAAATGMHGVAFGSTLELLRMVPGGTATSAPGVNSFVDSLNYLATLNNVRIFNASYGYAPPTGSTGFTVWPTNSIDAAEATAAQTALAAGKIIVAASGNERDDHPVAGKNPSGLGLYPFIQPANANTNVYADGGNNFNFSALLNQPGLIINVTAVDSNKAIGSFANLCGVSASWCVAAPGVDILSVVPTTANATGFATSTGTSMAAPHVSGALAVLSSAFPAYNSQDLARLLFATAEDLGAAGVDATFGYGLIRIDRAIAGPTALAAGADVNVAAFQNTFWSKPLTTTGAFGKSGLGNLIVAGRTTAGGDVTVNAGALGVDGTLTLNAFSLGVQQPATLAGFGQIAGNTTIAGTLSPGQLPNVQDQVANNGLPANTAIAGTSPGTLTFQGNVTLAATAVTSISVDGSLVIPGGPGTFSKLIITGANNVFSLGGAVAPVLRGIPGGNNTYTPPIGTNFGFLTALSGASVSGQFASVTQPATGLGPNSRFDVLYTAQTATLSVTPINIAAITPSTPLTPAQQQVAAALDGQRAVKGLAADTDPMFVDLFELSNEDAYATALNQLTSPGAPATPGAVLGGFASFANVIGGRQAALVSGAAGAQIAALPSTLAFAGRRNDIELHPAMMAFAGIDEGSKPAAARNGSAVWGQVFGSITRVGSTADAPGSTSRSSGFVVGADHYFTDDLLAGVAFGFARTNTSSDTLSGTTNTYSGAAYATWTPGNYVFNGRIAVGPSAISTSRTVDFMPGTITGSVTALGALVSGEAGYRIPVGSTTIKPFVGLDYQSLWRPGYTETQEDGLTYPAQTFTKTTARLGAATTLRLERNGFTYMPELRAAWGRDLQDNTLVTQASMFNTNFVVGAAQPGRDAALIDLTLTAWQREDFRVFATFSTELRKNMTAGQLAGGIRAAF